MDNYVSKFFDLLKWSVKKRIIGPDAFPGKKYSPFGVLFSGGLDSSVIAYLLHEVVPEYETIDLVNVSFMGEDAPDRQTARIAFKELESLSPGRQWKLSLVDVTPEMLEEARNDRIRHLIYPGNSVLDDSIGCALWFAARGDPSKRHGKVLFSGLGSDEQLAGYTRHRRVFQEKGYPGVIEELKQELDNLWIRNLGRDDRVVSDSGKEVRYPFLDEKLIEFLKLVPIKAKCDLTLPKGEGDKRLLRLLAKKIGFVQVAALEKRAIQFGSRIAKISNSGKEKGDMVCSRLVNSTA